jgi:NADH-quinone oxidoreductase subunit K
MLLFYPLIIAIILFSVGLAGIASSRNFILIILSAEVMIAASILAATAFFSVQHQQDGTFLQFLLSMWSIAGAEAMVLIAFYVKMHKYSVDFDVGKLNKFKN